HTRCLSDWSSDVCSSDLDNSLGKPGGHRVPSIPLPLGKTAEHLLRCPGDACAHGGREAGETLPWPTAHLTRERSTWWSGVSVTRSEERRVGKEWRCGGEM